MVEVHNAQLASNVSLGREHLDNEDKDTFNCENNIWLSLRMTCSRIMGKKIDCKKESEFLDNFLAVSDRKLVGGLN